MRWEIAHPAVLWGAAALPALWWSMRGLRETLPRARFTGVVITRHLLFASLLLGLAGAGSVRQLPRDPLVIYLVDRSSSMDAKERMWQVQTLARLDAGLSERAERQLLIFGGRARQLFHWDTHQAADAQQLATATASNVSDAVPSGATNIQAALLSSLSSTSEDRAKRIVLLSDGVQTEGDALQAANVARLERAPIYTMLPPSTGQEDVAVTKVLVPQVARRNAPTAIRVGLENSSQKTVRVRCVVRGPAGQSSALFDQRFELPPGKHLVDVPVRPDTTGGFVVMAHVDAAGDSVSPNNTRMAAFEVVGPPKILFIGGSRSQVPYLAQVLQARQMDVDLQDLSGLPSELSPLVAYDAVVLANVPRTSIDASRMELLTRYVQDFGGGLLMVGSGGDYANEARSRTALDAILPAWFTLEAPQEHETKTRLSLELLIDRSSSMSGERMTLMKRGAVELIKQLQSTDLLGVIAFDTRPFVVVPLGPVAMARATVVDQLVKLRAGGGTNFLPALVEAKAQVNATGSVIKHLILLSDGNTMDPNSPLYWQFVQECRAEGVTVSTMALGALFVDVDFMQFLARETGGTFYHVKDESEVPQLIVSDTQRQLTRAPFTEGWFHPSMTAPPHEALRGVEERDLPQLKGYLVMEAKPRASTSLVVNSDQREHDPLLVHWQAGLGRVTMFASDAESRWSVPWLSWDQYQKFWSQVVTWTMRHGSLTAASARLEYVGGSPQLLVHAPPPAQPVDQFAVRLIPAGEGAGGELALSRVSPTEWRTSLEGITPGLYQAVFLQQAHGQLVGEAKRWVDIAQRSLGLAQETTAAPADAELLTQLARRSGGAVDADPGTIVGQHTTQRIVTRWDRWLIPLFLLCFLVDVALRGETML